MNETLANGYSYVSTLNESFPISTNMVLAVFQKNWGSCAFDEISLSTERCLDLSFVYSTHPPFGQKYRKATYLKSSC